MIGDKLRKPFELAVAVLIITGVFFVAVAVFEKAREARVVQERIIIKKDMPTASVLARNGGYRIITSDEMVKLEAAVCPSSSKVPCGLRRLLWAGMLFIIQQRG